jgi:hypothetical protein
VNGGNLVSASLGGIVESVSCDSLGCFVRNELDRLDDTVDELYISFGSEERWNEMRVGRDPPRARYQSTLLPCFLESRQC